MEATKSITQAAPQQVQHGAAPAAAPAPRPAAPAVAAQQRAAEAHAEEASSEWTAWLNELGYTAQ